MKACFSRGGLQRGPGGAALPRLLHLRRAAPIRRDAARSADCGQLIYGTKNKVYFGRKRSLRANIFSRQSFSFESSTQIKFVLFYKSCRVQYLNSIMMSPILSRRFQSFDALFRRMFRSLCRWNPDLGYGNHDKLVRIKLRS